MRETAMQSQKSSSWLNIGKDFNTMTWVLIPVAIAINIAIGQIVVLLKLPVYLDSIGTVLVGGCCGPWAGAVTGALSNTIWGLAIDPNALPWWPVAFFIGLVAGFCARAGLFKSWWKVVVTGFLVALTAATVSTPIGCLHLWWNYSQRFLFYHRLFAPNGTRRFTGGIQHQLPGRAGG